MTGLPDVLSANALTLQDVLYPITGDVAVSGLGAFPPKVTIGDNTRDTAQLVSSINLGNFQGGWLHRILDPGQEPEWVWQSTADTRFRRQVTLPPQAQSGNAGLSTGPPSEYTKLFRRVGIVGGGADFTYAVATIGTAAAEKIISWHGNTWNNEHTGPATFDYQDIATLEIGLATNIIAGHSGGYSKQIGGGWVDVTTTGGPAGAPCPAITNVLAFGSTFYATDNAGYLWVCTDVSTNAWTRGGALPVVDLNNAGPCRALVTFRDKSGDPAIHAVTREGLAIYDIAANAWRPTELSFPYVRSTIYQRGVAVWRGDLYIAAGQTIFKYDGNTIENLGLDRVDGLPASFAQPVRYLCDTYNWLVAGTDFNIFAWDGVGWHLLWTAVGGTPNQYIQDLGYVVADQGLTTRLWWSTTDQNNVGAAASTITRYLDMDRTLFNPRTSTTFAYDSSAYLISPWYTAGWDELDKLWIEVNAAGEQIVAGNETIDIQYQLNLQADSDPTPWITLGTLSTNGPVRMPFATTPPATDDGVVAKSIRFRANMARRAGAGAPQNTFTPVLLYISVKFQRLLPRLYGFSFTVDVPRTVDLAGYRTPEALCTSLQTAYETQTLLTARFRRDGQEVGNIPARRVQVSQFVVQTRPGPDTGFKAQVSLVEVG
jgi:hypothetical protein